MAPTPQWTAEKMPDMTGRVVVVTGGNTGIGWETCKALLKKNAKVYLAARSPSKAQEAIERLKTETGREAIFLQLDLADLKSVRKSAEEFLSKEKELHVLFNNGGVMTPPVDQLTADGYDLQFGTNVLGHFFFTKLLLPSVLAATPTGRIINTTSNGHQFAPKIGIDWTTVKGPKTGGFFTKWKLYGQSKLGNILFTNELVRRYGDQGLISISVHPGGIKTDLQRHQGRIGQALADCFLQPAEYGAITQLYAGTDPEATSINGKYLVPWAKVGTPSAASSNEELAKKLWDWCEEQIKDF